MSTQKKMWSALFEFFPTFLRNMEVRGYLYLFIRRWQSLNLPTTIYIIFAHFMSLSHPYTATTVVRVFLDTIFKLHSFPLTIVSDKDPVFTNQFWRELFKMSGTKLILSSGYHPQTDGKIEIVNKGLEGYLRSFSRDRPHDWA